MTFYERLDEILPLHQEGIEGNAAAVEQANRLLEQLRLDYPDYPLAEAYHGSTMILIARDRTNPLEKLRLSKNGMRLLDNAVAASPQDSMIRLLRGKAAYALPEKHLHRTQTAIEDYTFLIDEELRQEGILGPEGYSTMIFELGEAYCRIGRNQDASRCWKGLEEQTKDPILLELLKQKLQSLEGKPAVENIPTPETPTSLLFRVAGSALQRWAEKEKEKEEKKSRRKHRKKKHRH